MGLDMHLSRRTYVKKWDHQKPEEQIDVKVTKGGKPLVGVNAEKVSYIIEEVGYWRKANQIHSWFVENTQDGHDNNGEESHVSTKKLQELLDICKRVLAASVLVDGKIVNGYMFDGKERKPILEDGKQIADSSLAQELLPTVSGFFFGSTGYDQYYILDLESTVEIIEQVLKDEKEGATGDIYYRSSW